MDGIKLMCKRSASITVAGLALGSLLLAGSPAGAQSFYPPYVDQRAVYQQPYNGWSGHTNSGWGGNTNDPRVERREAYQEQRIHQGIDDGSLTRGETRYLEKEQGRIDRAEDRMMADGNLSPRERQRLSQMQNQASRDIYRMENNNRTAGGYGNQAGWQDHNRGWDRRDYGRQDHDRGWDRRDYGSQGRNHDRDGRDYGWHGNNPVGAGHNPGENGYNHGWQGNGNSGWHGNNPNGNGTTAAGNTQGWRGSGNSGWQGHNSGGTTTAGYTRGQGTSGSGWQGHNSGGGTATSGTTTAGYTQGQGSSGSGWQGRNSGGGTTTGGTTTAGTQGGQGNYARNGQPGAYQQPGAQVGARTGQPATWQGQQQYQRPSMQQGAQPQMRPGQPAPWQGQQYQQARSPMPQTAMRPNTNMTARQPSGGLGGMVNRASFSGARRR